MKSEIKGNELILTIPIEEKASKSGKTILIATTNGFNNATGLTYKDKPVSISVNACIPIK